MYFGTCHTHLTEQSMNLEDAAVSDNVLMGPYYHCGLMFEPTRPQQKHCRPSCRMAAFKSRVGRPSLPGLREVEFFRTSV